MTTKTIAHDASPTHTHTRANLVIVFACVSAPVASDYAESSCGDGDLCGRQCCDPECATRDPVVAPANGELAEVKAGDDEHVEPEAEPERDERGDQQPARVLGHRKRGREDGERFGGHRQQQRRAHDR